MKPAFSVFLAACVAPGFSVRVVKGGADGVKAMIPPGGDTPEDGIELAEVSLSTEGNSSNLEFVMGAGGSTVCPSGSRAATLNECSQATSFFGKSGVSTENEVDSAPGCMHYSDDDRIWYNQNLNAIGYRMCRVICVKDSQAGPAPAPADPDTDAHAADMLRLVNSFRRSEGLGQLEYDSRLNRAAYVIVSDEFADSHTGSDGSSVSDRVCRTGYSPCWDVGENLYWRSSDRDASYAFNWWKNSPGHRRNMLRSSATKMGFARHEFGPSVEPKYKYASAQVFAA